MHAKHGLHGLCHAAVSLYIEQGWNAKRIQTVIGHASIQMTFDLYGKLFADDEGDKQAMARVEAAVLGGIGATWMRHEEFHINNFLTSNETF